MPSMKQIPAEIQPRERLRALGPQALSDAELIALLLRTGQAGTNVLEVAQQLLIRYGGLAGLLGVDYLELVGRSAIGEAKATTLLAAIELGKRLHQASFRERPVIRGPADVFRLVALDLAPALQEQVRVLCLDTKGRVEALVSLYLGTLDAAPVRIAEVFREPMRRNSASIVLVHNHPSGVPEPSDADIALTRHIARAGQLLEIPLQDHLIIGHNSFVSLRSLGYIMAQEGETNTWRQ